MNELINLKDRNGKEIREGDTVRFTITYDFSDPPQPTYDTKGGTVCTDKVVLKDGTAYFECSKGHGAAFAWRHNEHCEIISNE